MALRLPPHSHCQNCEGPVSEGEEFCSEECMRAKARVKRAEKSKSITFYALVVMIALILFALKIIL